MTGELQIRRRRRRASPMQSRRLGAALQGAAAGSAIAFPGIEIKEPETARGAWLGGSLAFLIHAGAIGALLLLTWLVPKEEIEEIIREVALLREEPVPSPEPAPAPKALAERSSVNFAPQPQAVAPQIVNPTVVARAAPAVNAEQLEMQAVGQVVAPRQIQRAAVVTDTVAAVSSVASAQARAIDVADSAAPALRGPIERQAPVGPSVGPRKVTVGGTSGLGRATTFELGGSSVREGIVTGRDVDGSPDGAPLANVNTRVGDGYLKGDGGAGSGPGGSFVACTQRPAVQAYLGQIHDRMLARWVLPQGASANQSVTLRFTLDAAGSAVQVETLSGSDQRLGSSAVQALRSAAPFPPMPDAARCLARRPITGTFRNPGES